jgi:hypothetical protein
VVEETREWLIAYLARNPCVDCGEKDIRVLEFDHLDPSTKHLPVAVLARGGFSLRRVIEEVSRCDVRCANCHRRRTHLQRGWWGTTVTAEVVESAPCLAPVDALLNGFG